MRQSSVVNEWIEEGRVEGRQEGRVELLEAIHETKFGPLPEASLAALRALPRVGGESISVQ